MLVCASAVSAKLNIAGWSSLVARRAHNPKVVGSNPAPATKKPQVRGSKASDLFLCLNALPHILPHRPI